MFPRRYFAGHYFAPRYWPDGGTVVPPVVVTDTRDTHDGWVDQSPRPDPKKQREEREEVRKRLEAAFEQADRALEPVEVLEIRAKETPPQLIDIQGAREALDRFEALGFKLAKAEARRMKEYQRRLMEAEKEMALLMTIALL